MGLWGGYRPPLRSPPALLKKKLFFLLRSTPGRDCSEGWDLRHLLRSNPKRGCSEAGNKVWEPRGERTKWGAEGRWDSERTKWGAVAPPIIFFASLVAQFRLPQRSFSVEAGGNSPMFCSNSVFISFLGCSRNPLIRLNLLYFSNCSFEMFSTY